MSRPWHASSPANIGSGAGHAPAHLLTLATIIRCAAFEAAPMLIESVIATCAFLFANRATRQVTHKTKPNLGHGHVKKQSTDHSLLSTKRHARHTKSALCRTRSLPHLASYLRCQHCSSRPLAHHHPLSSQQLLSSCATNKTRCDTTFKTPLMVPVWV